MDLIGKKTGSLVLFLPGVFKKDCRRVEEIFTDRFYDTPDYDKYDKIPPYFTTIEDSPTHTNLKCWSCCMNFKTRPWFEPLRLSKNKIARHGNFCSPCCVALYIELHTNNPAMRQDKLNMLKYVYFLYTGNHVITIKPALPHTCMLEYGGDTTPEAYIKSLEQIETAHMVERDAANFGKMNMADLLKIVNAGTPGNPHLP
jgi:hypothetical protein